MPFDVYPQPPSAPESVAAGSPSPLIPITERAAIDPSTGRNTMVLRFVELGSGGTSAPEPPTIRLMADDGAPVNLPQSPATVRIFGDAAGTGPPVATGTLRAEDHRIWRVDVEVLRAGSSWQIQIVNHDSTEARFTWVVADSDRDSRQPWIDLPQHLAFDVFAGHTQGQHLPVSNHGTGLLEIHDLDGLDLGNGFVLSTVGTGTVDPNTGSDVEIQFTAPSAVEFQAGVYEVSCNDTTAGVTAGHNSRVVLAGSVRQPLWEPGDILVADAEAFNGPGGVIRVRPETGEQTVVSSGGTFVAPVGLVLADDESVLVIDADAAQNTGALIRVNRFTGAQTTVCAGGEFRDPTGVAVDGDGSVLVADPDAFDGGAVVVVDPQTGAQAMLPGSGGFLKPAALLVMDDGSVLVAGRAPAGGPGGVVRIDRQGVQTTITSGTMLVGPTGVAVDVDGSIVVADQLIAGPLGLGASGGVVRVDQFGGQTMILSGEEGAMSLQSSGVAIDSEGNLLIVGPGTQTLGGGPGGVLRVDRSGQTHAVSHGLLFQAPVGVTVVPGAP